MRRYESPLALLWGASAAPSAAAPVPRGLSVALLSEGAANGSMQVFSDLPYLLNRRIGTDSDPALAFKSALAASVVAAVREDQALGDSALSRLRGATLVTAAPSTNVDVTALSAGDAARARFLERLRNLDNCHRLISTTDNVAWVIDPATGWAVAMDESGRGGAGGLLDCKDNEFVNFFLTVGNILNMALSVFCTVGGDDTKPAPGASAAEQRFAWLCLRNTVASAALLAAGAFVAPVNVPHPEWALGAVGVAWGFASKPLDPNIPGPIKVFARAVKAVLQLALSLIGSANYCK